MSENNDGGPRQLRVTKENGSVEPFDAKKVVRLLRALKFGLHAEFLDEEEAARKIESGIYDLITSRDLVSLIAETLAYKTTYHPDYSIWASRVSITALHKQVSENLSVYARALHGYKDEFGRNCQILSDESLRVFIENHDALQAIIDYKRDFDYDFFGLKTLEKSYLLRINGKIAERPQQMLMRVSVGIYLDDIDSVIESYKMLSEKWFTHATPTLFNSGLRYPQMSSCYLLSMSGDSIEGIYDTLKRCALISKYAGGIGVSMSCIRAKGSYIRGTNGYSNGLVPMLRVYDVTARYVDQGGGKRKGSFAIYIEPWHADIYDFISLRKNHGKDEMRARDLFLALWTPDIFMRRVRDDEDWTLMCPAECPGLQDCWGEQFDALYTRYETEGRGRRKVRARHLFNEIIQAQIETGTPYILYKDACNSKSNQQNLGTIRCSNLCTEIIEYTSNDEVAVCNLASIALPRFVDVANRKFDFAELIRVTRRVVISLNRVIDRNFYPIAEARRSNERHRPIGIGVQGLADTFALVGLDYDGEEALELNNRIFETIYYAACLESANLARKEGPYSTFEGSPASRGILQFDMWNVSAKMYDWDALKTEIKAHGMRNSLLLAPMPTASTSQILGNNETFEAFTSNVYSRRVLSGEFICVNRHLINALIAQNLWTERVRQKIIALNGSVQSIAEIPEATRRLFRTVWEIPQKAVIRLAAGRGPFIDQSQSLNIFMSEPEASKISSMHFYGWQSGLKTGMYYLRTRPAADAIKFTADQETLLEMKQKAAAPAKKAKLATMTAEEFEEQSECLNCGS